MENIDEYQKMHVPPDVAESEHCDVGQYFILVFGSDMTGKSENGLRGKLGNIFKLDWVFGLLLIVSGIILVHENVDPEPMVDVAPWMKIGILAAMTLVVGVITTYFAALDRRHAEDYFFQLMSNGAITGLVTAMFVNILWDAIYGPLRGDDLIAIMMAGWCLGYFFYRIRGLNS